METANTDSAFKTLNYKVQETAIARGTYKVEGALLFFVFFKETFYFEIISDLQ